jgi:hypothetical protein
MWRQNTIFLGKSVYTETTEMSSNNAGDEGARTLRLPTYCSIPLQPLLASGSHPVAACGTIGLFNHFCIAILLD